MNRRLSAWRKQGEGFGAFARQISLTFLSRFAGDAFQLLSDSWMIAARFLGAVTGKQVTRLRCQTRLSHKRKEKS